MESSDEERPRDYLDGARNAGASDLLKARITELARTKDEIKKARDVAMQSWLDSRPLLDELEKLQATVESARSRASVSSVLALELQSQLESTEASIQAKKRDELGATKAVNELTLELDRTRGGTDALKQEIDEGRRVRQKLKQVLRVKRHRLRALQLGMRAVRVEAEAAGESEAEAARLMNCAQRESGLVTLSGEEYWELVRRAEEEESLAEWRVAASMEQRQAAEGSRNLALARLREARGGSRSSRRVKEEEIEEEGDLRDGVEGKVSGRGSVFPKARARAMAEEADHGGGGTGRRSGRTRSDVERKVARMKKKEKTPSSIFGKLRKFLAKSMAKIFG
ncbi:hypothetical protein BT93_J0996 [Corymbia citriodora subsp. variegata]|nr:hypothetical protein BT93_J0996 [Corymbia citriodora subsp. variegata]